MNDLAASYAEFDDQTSNNVKEMLLAEANDITKDLRIWHGDAYIVEEEDFEEFTADE